MDGSSPPLAPEDTGRDQNPSQRPTNMSASTEEEHRTDDNQVLPFPVQDYEYQERMGLRLRPCTKFHQLFVAEYEREAMAALFRSHVYSALGAVLSIQQPMIVWCDLDQEEITTHPEVEKKSAKRIYYAGPVKARQYYYYSLVLEEVHEYASGCPDLSVREKKRTDEVLFAIAPAMQRRRMDARAGFGLLKELREHGLISCTKRWREISDKPVLCLILHPMLANQPEVRENLKKWLKEPGHTLDCWGEEDASK